MELFHFSIKNVNLFLREPLADYKNKQKKNQEDYQKAMDKEKREMLEAEQLKAQYEKRAGER